MNFEQIVDLIRELDRQGRLHNLAADFVWIVRDEADGGARHGSNILRLRRRARGYQVAVDDAMRKTADEFERWLEAMNR